MRSKKQFCDNAGRTAGGLGAVGCWDNGIDRTLLIEYDDHGVDTDTVDVCDHCADRIREEAERHGYTVTEM